MKELIAGFPNQLTEAIKLGEKMNLSLDGDDIGQVVISGMGGSGIGGNIVEVIANLGMRIPLIVNKNYFLPNFTYRDSLVIISSYSGNTEETINAFNSAFIQGAKIIAISSGGQIGELCEKHGIDWVKVPGGMPPRAALGYSLVQQLYILFNLRMIGHETLDELKMAVDLLKKEQTEIQALARALAGELAGFIPVIYTTAQFEPVAVRLRQQLNENAKMLAWHNVVPEMNHNEIVGWGRDYKNLAALFLRHENEFERNRHRIRITKNIIAQHAPVHEVHAKGVSLLGQLLYLVHFGDWLSLFLAEARGVDPMEIAAIDRLKGELGKV